MTPTLTTQDLFKAQSALLKLQCVAGESGMDRLLEPATAKYPGLALVGHMNFVHPNRIQVLGANEVDYLGRLSLEERHKAISDIFSYEHTAAVVISAGRTADPDLAAAADEYRLPLLASELPSPVLIEYLQYYLTRALAPRVTLHGVYMEVMGMGVFITGESGIGKSELALELLSRGHRLIADDAVEFIRVGPDALVGQCPEALADFLEVRGLGLLNIRAMFGETAVRHKKKLHLIVRLEQLKAHNMARINRLQPEQLTRTILEVDHPEVVLYVAPGRNLAVLVEAATRAYILRMWDINPVDEFIRRQQALIDKSSQ